MIDQQLERLKLSHEYPLVKERTNTGASAAMLGPFGQQTPQSLAWGQTNAALEKCDALIADWYPAQFPVVFADALCTVQTFEVPMQPNVRYAVVVNHDAQAKHDFNLLLTPNVRRVTDTVSDKKFGISAAANDPADLLQAKVSLQAGDGTILKIEFRDDRPGVLLFAEDFGCGPCSVTFENAERRSFLNMFGLGEHWAAVEISRQGGKRRGSSTAEGRSGAYHKDQRRGQIKAPLAGL